MTAVFFGVSLFAMCMKSHYSATTGRLIGMLIAAMGFVIIVVFT